MDIDQNPGVAGEITFAIDIMTEKLDSFIERAVVLKEQVEDLKHFLSDLQNPLTEEKIRNLQKTLRRTRELYQIF